MENEGGLFTIVGQFFGLIDKCDTEKSLQSDFGDGTGYFFQEEMSSNSEERDAKKYEETEEKIQSTVLNDNSADENVPTGDSVDYNRFRKEVQENYNCVLNQLRQIIQSQQSLNSSIDQLRGSMEDLGNYVKLSAIYDGVKKLITLWKLVNCSNEEISEYYSEILYDAFISFGMTAISPQPGEIYYPEYHQKENSSMVSNIISSCEKYNWGWKIDDVVLKKAIVAIQSKEVFENESIV